LCIASLASDAAIAQIVVTHYTLKRKIGQAREIFRREAARGCRVPTVRGLATRDYPLPARRPANSWLD